jgi:O-antigen ligase
MDSWTGPSIASKGRLRPVQKRVALAPVALDQAPPLSRLGPEARSSIVEKIAFFLFLLVNGALFLRPSEILADLAEAPIYEVLILTCLLFSCAQVLRLLRPRSLVDRPITLCVLGLLPAVALSHFSHLKLGDGVYAAIEFSKLIVYYVLFVALVNSTARLRVFLFVLAAFIAGLTVLALLQYHGLMEIETLAPLVFKAAADPLTGERAIFLRLRGAGIFHDPNDLCLILVMGTLISIYGFSTGLRVVRLGWLVLPGLFAYALSLTQSRGGFLGALASVLVLFLGRFGWKRTMVLGVVVVPLFFALFAGRQASIISSLDDDTGQSRVQLWSDGLQMFREAPLFGVGQGEYAERAGNGAHNSFLNAFTELGFLGGALFLGAFYLCFHSLHRPGSMDPRTLDPGLVKLRPYLLAIVTGYVTGTLSLNRLYVAPTYVVLGLASAFATCTENGPLYCLPRFNLALLRRLVLVSMAFLIGLYVFVRIFANFGRS